MSIEKIERELRDGIDAASKGRWQEGHNWVFIDPIDPERNPTHALRNLLRDVPDEELQANVKHIVAAQPENIRALLDELSRLREAERALGDLQSWVRQSRIDLQPLDPDFHPKYETLKAIGAKIRAARALSEREGQDG